MSYTLFNPTMEGKDYPCYICDECGKELDNKQKLLVHRLGKGIRCAYVNDYIEATKNMKPNLISKSVQKLLKRVAAYKASLQKINNAKVDSPTPFCPSSIVKETPIPPPAGVVGKKRPASPTNP